MEANTIQVGDMVDRSVIKGGYWTDSYKARVLAIKGDRIKVEGLSLRAPDRPVWVKRENCRKLNADGYWA